jgi:hypothetical protein
MFKNEKLLQHLEEGKAITKHEADYLYKIGSLTKEISTLRASGLNITGEWKFDELNNRYMSYTLAEAA